jgi:6-pyruvoyltetrahydropterin/6-carboxytetrahydropterin synthase
MLSVEVRSFMSTRGPGRHRLFVGKDVHKFSCAHMTVFPDGSKERLHGHNFNVILAIDLVGADPDLLDFALLKKAMQAQCEEWTERLLLPAESSDLVVLRHDQAELEFRLCGKRYIVPAEDALLLPTRNVVVESLARLFAERMLERIGSALRPDLVCGLEITVTESDGQGASYSVDLPRS